MGRFESNKSRNYFLVHNAPATTTNHIVNHHLFTHLDSKGTFGEGISIQDNIYLVGKGGSILDHTSIDRIDGHIENSPTPLFFYFAFVWTNISVHSSFFFLQVLVQFLHFVVGEPD